MNENKNRGWLLFLIITILFTINIADGTFAKYTTDIESTNKSYVAKWDIELNNNSWSDTTEFNLFNYTEYNLDVKAANSEKLVAPGTEGIFNFSVKNNSDVASNYSIDLLITNESEIPIEYKIKNGDWIIPDDNKLVLATNEKLSVNEYKIIPVEWRWRYTGEASSNFNNTQTVETDTQLGIDGNSTISAKAIIKARQID